MSTRRVILDSDDEGSDSSPAKPIDAFEELFSSAEAPNQPQHATNSFQTTGTTDSSFFQKLYDEHRVLTPTDAQDHNGDLVQPAVLPGKSRTPFVTSPAGEEKKQKESWLDLGTSITDPVPASRKLKAKPAVDLSLTQVTTPRKEAASGQVDPWEIPSSPPVAMGKRGVAALSSSGRQSQSKVAKTYGSRKRTRCSSPPLGLLADDGEDVNRPETVNGKSEIPGGTEVSLIRTSKERTGGTPVSAQRPQDGSFEDFNQSRGHEITGVAINGASSAVEDLITRAQVPVSLYVSTVSLTASQKQEYRLIPPSSEPDQQGEYGLPSLVGRSEQIQKSSGATTIAYTTPSDFASSGRKAGSALELSSTKKRKLKSITEEIPPSSPDILSVTPEATKKQPRDFYDELPSSEAEFFITTRSARKRPARRENPANSCAQEDSLDYEAVGAHREQGRRGSHRRKSDCEAPGADAAMFELHKMPTLAANASAVTTETWVFVDEPVSLASNMEALNNEEADRAVVGSETPKAKKKGRKKKETQSQDALVVPSDNLGGSPTMVPTEIVDDGEVAEPTAKRKRGRPRKEDKVKATESDAKPEEPVDTDDHYPPPPGHTEQAGLQVYTVGKPTDAVEGPVGDQPLPQPKKRGRKRKLRDEDTMEASGMAKEPAVLEVSAGNLSKVFEASSDKKALSKVIDEVGTGADGHLPFLNKTPIKEAKESVKPASSTQPGKVLYRVGLSKRSRIAPLLKSLRK